MNDERNLWQRLLRIEAPWRVLDCDFDGDRQYCEVTVGLEESRAWFGLSRRPAGETEPVTWRHQNFGEWEVRVRVLVPPNADLSHQPWQGQRDQPFTHALSHEIFAMLREGLTLPGICKLTGVRIEDLWRFRHAMDQGKWSTTTCGDKAASQAPEATETDVPEITSAVWAGMARGSLDIDIRVLSLKMLLGRLRSQLERTSDEEVVMLKLQELRRYFVNNRHLLVHELNQIRGQR